MFSKITLDTHSISRDCSLVHGNPNRKETQISNLHLTILDGKPVGALAAELTVGDLSVLYGQIAEVEALTKARKATLGAIMKTNFAEAVSAQLLANGQDTGTVHLIHGEFDVKAEVSKTVKWDQTKIIDALETIEQRYGTGTANHYAKTTVEVSETVYKSAPPDIQKILQPARTLTPSAPKFEILLAKQEAA